MQRALVIAVAALALLVSCIGERRVRETVAPEVVVRHRAQSIADARALQRRFSHYDRVPQREWPASFRAFDPKRVSVAPHGVYVTTYEFFVAAGGLYIRLNPAYEPPARGDPGFTPLAPDLYWYYGGG